jgi:CHAT domain-containing protein
VIHDHVVSGFQVAGFPHVVGCLWPAGDEECVEVARLFYSSVLQSLALALQEAVMAGYQHAAELGAVCPPRGMRDDSSCKPVKVITYEIYSSDESKIRQLLYEETGLAIFRLSFCLFVHSRLSHSFVSRTEQQQYHPSFTVDYQYTHA